MSPVVKRPKDKFKLPTKYWLLILSTLCVIMMALTFLFDFKIEAPNFVVGFTLVPFQSGISDIGIYFTEKAELISQINDLIAENNELKEKVSSMEMEITTLTQDKYELNNLRTLYELDDRYSNLQKTGARVISGGSDNWFNVFAINKGEADGIAKDMNVMAGAGLVGRVVEVGPNWSKVLTVIDDSSNVSCMVLSTSDTLMVSGDLETMKDGYIKFSSLSDKDDNVKIGDKVVTSYISDKFLPGILVGYISYIESDSNGLTKSGYITPAVDFEHLSEVLVVLDLKENAEEQ